MSLVLLDTLPWYIAAGATVFVGVAIVAVKEVRDARKRRHRKKSIMMITTEQQLKGFEKRQ